MRRGKALTTISFPQRWAYATDPQLPLPLKCVPQLVIFPIKLNKLPTQKKNVIILGRTKGISVIYTKAFMC